MTNSVRRTQTRSAHILKLAIWTALWLISVALASQADGVISRPVAIVLLALNAALSVGLIHATIQHLRTLDEMMQKIQLEAMGIALGVAVIGGLSYSLVQQSGVINFEVSIAHLVMAVTLAYLLAIVYAYRRLQ